MCKYCENREEGIKDDEKNPNIIIYPSKNAEIRFYGSGWHAVTVKFNFCPICGIKFKEDERNDNK